MIKSNKNNKKKKGFTLVELVAVIAIIGILAAVLVPKITGYIRESKKVETIDQARKVVTAGESIKIKTGKSDGDLATLTLEQIQKMSGGLVLEAEVDKINGCLESTEVDKVTGEAVKGAIEGKTYVAVYEDCVNMLKQETYSFNVDNKGNLTAKPELIDEKKS